MTTPNLAPGDPPPTHDAAARDAIAAELVRCTLGQNHRPELRADLVGSLARVGRFITQAVADARKFNEAMARIAAVMKIKPDGPQ